MVVFFFFFYKFKARPSASKKITARFTVRLASVQWPRTQPISEVCLYLYTYSPFGAYQQPSH